MVDGRIRQHDRVADVFERPADREVARCVGVDTVLAGRIVGTGDGLVAVEAHGLRLAAVDRGLGGDVWVLLRAEDVVLERGGGARSSARNHLPGRVTAVTPEGPLVQGRPRLRGAPASRPSSPAPPGPTSPWRKGPRSSPSSRRRRSTSYPRV